MDSYQATGTGFAAAMLAKSGLRRTSLGHEIRSKGGVYVSIADRWFEGDRMIGEGRSMMGWFSSRARRSDGQSLVDEGVRLKERAEADYRVRMGKPDVESI